MKEERLTTKDLIEIYKVDLTTIKNWIRYRGLPMIEISTHKKFIRIEDLINWENDRKQNESK